ncbi:MAG: hypothetical protein GY822_32405 [Deltaproteobacteria bacterium]|nr:hypothetical protein [Deltaproteobacteria bacterium]
MNFSKRSSFHLAVAVSVDSSTPSCSHFSFGCHTMTKSLLFISLLLLSFSAAAAPSFVPLVAYVERDGTPMNETVPIEVLLHDEGATGGSSVALDVEVTLVDGLLVVDLVIDENAMAQAGADPVFEIILDDEEMGEIRVGEVLFARNANHAETATNATTATSATTATTANAVAWENITGMPAGFVDGVDANTAYFAGDGLSSSGTTFSISSGGVTSSHLAPGSVGYSEIATNAVASLKIINGTILAEDLAAGSVGASEIATNAVGSSEIAADAVRASEIQAGAVTNAKLNLATTTGIIGVSNSYYQTSNSNSESCGVAVGAQFCGLTYNNCYGTGDCQCKITKTTSSNWQLCARGDASFLGIAGCGMSCF